jgi:hypothetical protein
LRLVLVQPMLGHQPGEEGAVHAPGDVVPGRDREEGAGVVVEADRVVEARRLGGLLAEAAHALGLSWNHQAGRASGRIVAGERRELAGIGGLVRVKRIRRQVRLVAEAVEQGFSART